MTDPATGRLRLAVPNKGRMVEPTLRLLHDAGLVFEEHDRSLVSRVQNFALDILFVRTNDVIEFVGDGVADLGITGIDLLTESGAELPRVRALGYGRCRLAAAVLNDSPVRDLADLAGLRIATAHPNSARRFFASKDIAVDIIPISGAVEVAPRLGLAEAIVDLVSTGSTMDANGLRPVGTLLDSQAVLIGGTAAVEARHELVERLELMLSGVVAARRHRYVMMNAHVDDLPAIRAVLPGMGAPSVLQLADEGEIAVHAAVDASDVWELLPVLRDAGATSILVLPIERLVA